MNFGTPIFLLGFLPLSLVVFHHLPARFRVHFILLASIVFYGASGLIPLFLLIIVVVWAFSCSEFVSSRRSKPALWVSISVPLAALIVTKYTSFLLDNFGVNVSQYPIIDKIAEIALPAGISFYTFQIMSYLIDVRDGAISKERNIIKFAAFVSFFPQLIAGPILRYQQISAQLARLAEERDLHIDWMRGIKYCVFGLVYKIIFADVLHNMHADYTLESSSNDALFNVLSYSAIIYFDFWGYSLMAIGIGVLFGISLPRNFAEPYLSKTPKEFWRRWHITLSYWLRDNVYIKMGGNTNYVRNIIIVFLLIGLWHGAGWSFIVWGAYHASLVVFYHLTRSYWGKAPAIIQIATTFLLVSLGWPLFYLDIPDYLQLYSSVFSFESSVTSQFQFFEWGYLFCVYLWIFFVRENKVLFSEKKQLSDQPVLLALAACLAISMLDQGRTFIYFQF